MEVWEDIEGYEGYYQVSDLGRVKGVKRICKTWNGYRGVPETIIVGSLDKRGYPQVNLSISDITECYKVHRLVAIAFIPNPDNKPDVNHKDGVKTNNFKDNLEWNTKKENTQHAHRTGLARGRRGEEHGQTNLTEIQAIDIKYNHNGKTGVELARMYGITTSSVSAIRTGKRWKYI